MRDETPFHEYFYLWHGNQSGNSQILFDYEKWEEEDKKKDKKKEKKKEIQNEKD